MRQKFTTTRMLMALAAFLIAGIANLTAQGNYNLDIADPVSIAGTYLAVPAAFGGADFCTDGTTTGDLIISDDGNGTTSDACEPIVNDLTGKIALIDRGACEFGVKCLGAETAGAMMAIVCNNQDTPPFAMAPGAVGDQVTIPCFMMSKADCDLIRVEIPNGVTVSLSPDKTTIPDGLNILWGANPGEGDFNGGLNGWTANNISCSNGVTGFELWRWDPEGDISDQGAFVGGGGIITSPSGCDGAAFFDSDFYDNNGDSGNLGGGDCTAIQIGELISPSIDISGFSVTGVSLMFYQALRQFQSNYFVGWSIDGGVTWDSVQINTEVVVNSAHLNMWTTVPLPGTAGASDLRIKFRDEANYYYWMIDNVMVIEQEANNMRVNSNFFAVPQNAMFPADELDPIHFLADIENIGASAQNNVNLNMTISDDATGTSVFSTDKAYGTIPGNTLAENGIFAEQFIPDLGIGSYTGAYTVSQDETDFDDSDNSLSFNFMVSDSTYAKEFGATRDIRPANANWDMGEAHSWAYGNCFFIPKGDGLMATSISFSIGNGDEADAPIGQAMLVTLYEWVDANGDGDAQPDERTQKGQEFYIVQGTETDNTIITIPFGEETGGPVDLKDNTYYLAMIEFISPDENTNLSFRASDAIDYLAMRFLTDSLQLPRFADMLAIDENLQQQDYTSNTFVGTSVPNVRLNITPLVVAVNDPLPEENLVAVYPNPVSNQLNLQLGFKQAAEQVLVQIMDVAGRLTYQNTYDNIQKQTLPISTENLATGTYLLRVTTEIGSRTKKFIVIK